MGKYKATIMLGTSTFFRLYAKNPKAREDFTNKFGKEIIEGYGVTETTPVASCNIPDIQSPDKSVQVGNKIGTVGMPIPGTKFKIVDPDSHEELETGEEGMILIGGVQVMKGYQKDKSK